MFSTLKIKYEYNNINIKHFLFVPVLCKHRYTHFFLILDTYSDYHNIQDY